MTGYHLHRYFRDEEEEHKRKVPDRVLISRLLKYVLPHRTKLAVALIAITISSIADLLWPKLLQVAIDKYIIPGELFGLIIISLILVGVKLANWVTECLKTYEISWIGQDMLYKMRVQMFSRLQELSFSFYDQSETGRIMSRVTNDTDSLGEVFVQGVVDVFSQLLTLTLIIVMMFSMSVPLTLASMIVVPLLLASALVFQSRFRSVYRRARRKIAGVTSRLQEGISGVRETQAFTREKAAMEDFRQANVENLQANVQVSKVFGVFRPVVEIIGAIGTCAILLYGGMLYAGGRTTIGTLIAFSLYNQMFFGPILTLTLFYNQIQSAMAASERIFEVLDTVPEVRDAPDAIGLPPVIGEVKFENVTFGYDPNHPVLHDISFHVKPKETLALVGPTGAGKSTVIKLLSRFYEPQSGVITIDGHDVREVTRESFRRQMGIVLQETFLSSGTVKENIRYGKLDATDEEVMEAARMVGAHEFITRLPEGYDTNVGERGSSLSVGQRQLVAFARGLLRNPPILILDEATSSVDPYTELIIKKALAVLLKKRTSIVIAHRLSTVRNADRILVIDNGRIIEEGSHTKLMRKGGLYRHLYEMQFKEPEEMDLKPMITVSHHSTPETRAKPSNPKKKDLTEKK